MACAPVATGVMVMVWNSFELAAMLSDAGLVTSAGDTSVLVAILT